MNRRTTLSLATLLAATLSTPLAAQLPTKTEGDAPKLLNGSLRIQEIPGPRTVGPGGAMQHGIQTGDLLQAETGVWTPASPQITLEVQWFRCTSPIACAPIPGQTRGQYLVAPEDLGYGLAITVTATGKSGKAMYRSQLTVQVEKPKEIAPKLHPGSVAGIRRQATPGRGGPNRPMEVGDELIAMPGSWDQPIQGEATTQWERCASPSPESCRAIRGAKGPRYTLTQDEVGTQVRFVQTVTSTANVKGTAESAMTDKVVPAQPADKKP